MIWPFENDTSCIEKKLAAKSVAAFKTRTVLIGVIIFISAVLLSFSSLLLCNGALHGKQTAGVDNEIEVSLTILVIVLLLFCTAGLAIKNIVYVSVLQRVQEFAQLRAIGATYGQIKAIVKRERIQMAAPCILTGLVLGVVLSAAMPLPFYWLPSVVCALIAGMFAWSITALAFRSPVKLAASVSPIAAQQQKMGALQAGWAKGRLTAAGIGWRYCWSNPKKTAYTILSLLLSGILMCTVFSILYAIDPQQIAGQSYPENSDLYIQLNSAAHEDSTYQLMKDSPFTQAQKQKLCHISGVNDVYALYMLDCTLTDSAGVQHELAIETILDSDGFAKEIAAGAMPDAAWQSGTVPVVINRQSPYYQALQLSLQVGDLLPAVMDTGYTQQEVTLAVCGFADKKDTGVVLYTSDAALLTLSQINCTLIWYVSLDDAYSQAAAAEIKNLFHDDDRVSVSVLAEDAAVLEQYFYYARLMITCLTVLVSLFSFVNLLNTSITNTITRKREYALLEATGMTKGQLRTAQRTENLVYLLGSFVGSCVLGIPFGMFICHQIAQIPGLSYFAYHFPTLFVCVYFTVTLLVYGMVSLYQNRSQQQSVIERIRIV